MSPQDIGGIHPTAMNHPNEKIPAVHVNRRHSRNPYESSSFR